MYPALLCLLIIAAKRTVQTIFNYMVFKLVPTLFDGLLSDADIAAQPIDYITAQKIFDSLQQQTIFNWGSTHNFCEARAEAASLILTATGIAHAKAWVFGAGFLRKNYVGGLINNWNYHVAIAIYVSNDATDQWYVLDPSIANQPLLLNDWASSVTQYPHSYHCIKKSSYYIFPSGNIVKDKWHHRNPQNFKWVIQCLAGINGLTNTGKAQLVFRKKKIADTKNQFMLCLQSFHNRY